jgi:copper chaperone CopZ
MRSLAFAFVLSLALPFVAAAEAVQYAIPAKGVSCGGTAAHATQSVKRAVPVEAVVANHETGVVTATFDDSEVDVAQVRQALHEAGYETGEPERLN